MSVTSDNRPLSVKPRDLDGPPDRPVRRQRERESPEIGAMLLRVVDAMVRRVEAGDLLALEGLATLQSFVDDAMRRAGRAAHDGPAAYSWTDIALTLGVTRQAARQRFRGGRPGLPDHTRDRVDSGSWQRPR